MQFTAHTNLGFSVLLLLLLSGCGTALFDPLQYKHARVGERTPYTKALKSLPAPKEPILVAVYQFRDQTGQYRPSDGGAGFSTAVTQGGATILQHVLTESGWFEPIERENIGDLLNERKIIRSTRQQFGVNEELPALLYAGVLLEGGIISYDANVITGGSGLRYFGTGGSSQYRQDRVTVYLRAVSVVNGKILKTVYASKMVLSQALDGGVFRFVSFQRLLEAETGFTYNEPSELAVTAAIEKAVEALIIEGLESDLWELKDPTKEKELLQNYKGGKLEEEKTDIYGRIAEDRRGKIGLDVRAQAVQYAGDYARPKWTNALGLGLTYGLNPTSALEIRADAGQLATFGGFSTDYQSAELNYRYRYLPYNRFSTSLWGGLGGIRSSFTAAPVPKAQFGLGFEFFPKNNFSLSLNGSMHQTFSEKLDGVEQGRRQDAYYTAEIGAHFYFGKKLEKKKKLGFAAPEPAAKPRGPLQDF